MNTIEITKNNLTETLKNNDIVLLDFWASWCGPCRAFGPIFEKTAANHPDVVFGKVNTETEQELAAAFQIRSIPTIMAFRQKIPVFVQPGLLPENSLNDLISKIKGLDMEILKMNASSQATKGVLS